MLKFILLWFPMLLIAVINGVIREAWFVKHMPTAAAHRVSTLTLIFLFAIYMAIIFSHFKLQSATHAVSVGLTWMVMTLIFEFGFGLYRGKEWAELLGDYNIFQGRLWVLIPLSLAVGPYIFYRYVK